MAPSLCFGALAMDAAFACKTGGMSFFNPLVKRKLIEEKPYMVEDSVSHYRPIVQAPDDPRSLYAFGLRVDAVFAYVSGQPRFRRGPGTEPPNTYGVIVTASVSETNSRLFAAGATTAITEVISENRTSIRCEGT